MCSFVLTSKQDFDFLEFEYKFFNSEQMHTLNGYRNVGLQYAAKKQEVWQNA